MREDLQGHTIYTERDKPCDGVSEGMLQDLHQYSLHSPFRGQQQDRPIQPQQQRHRVENRNAWPIEELTAKTDCAAVAADTGVVVTVVREADVDCTLTVFDDGWEASTHSLGLEEERVEGMSQYAECQAEIPYDADVVAAAEESTFQAVGQGRVKVDVAGDEERGKDSMSAGWERMAAMTAFAQAAVIHTGVVAAAVAYCGFAAAAWVHVEGCR